MRLEIILLLICAKKIFCIPIMVKYNDIIIRGKENTYFTEIIQDSPNLKVHARDENNKHYTNKDKIIIKIIASPQFLTTKPKSSLKSKEHNIELNIPAQLRNNEELINSEQGVASLENQSKNKLFHTEDARENPATNKQKRSTKVKRDLISAVLRAFSGLGYDSYYKNYMKTMYPEKYKYIDRSDNYGYNNNKLTNDYFYQRRMQPKIVYGWIDKKDFNLAAEMSDPDATPWT